MTVSFSRKLMMSASVSLLIACMPLASYAGGVGLGTTRIVYPSQSKQVSLSVSNSDATSVFLVQSWIDTVEGAKSEDFAITPSLFKIQPKGENILRIAYAGEPLPQDRESLFWVNVKAIPPVGSAAAGQSTLQLAVVSRIKMFYRPSGLELNPNAAPPLVRAEQSGQRLLLDNPTPYFVNLVKITVGGQSVSNKMIAPKSTVEMELPKGVTGAVSYHAVNDYGAQIKIK